MARLQIGGGNTRVGEVYLDMLFRQRALDNARSEAAQRAGIESARLQASERNAERDAQMQMLQMEQQSRMAQEARAATQTENQAQRQFSAEQQAASLGWDKEKLSKEIESREGMAAAKEKSDREMEAKRFTQQKELMKEQADIQDRRSAEDKRMDLLNTAAANGIYVPDEWRDMELSDLASSIGALVKESKTEQESDKFDADLAKGGISYDGMSGKYKVRAAAVTAKQEVLRAAERVDKLAMIVAQGGTFEQQQELAREQAVWKLLSQYADGIKDFVAKDDIGNITYNDSGHAKFKSAIDEAVSAIRSGKKAKGGDAGASGVSEVNEQEPSHVGIGLVRERDIPARTTTPSTGPLPTQEWGRRTTATSFGKPHKIVRGETAPTDLNLRGMSTRQAIRAVEKAGPNTGVAFDPFAPTTPINKFQPTKIVRGNSYTLPANGAFNQTEAEDMSLIPQNLLPAPGDDDFVLDMKRKGQAAFLEELREKRRM